MENIKFRVWDNVDYMSKPFTLLDVQRRLTQFTHDCSVMRFTGFTDIKGVEIYEGDIFYDGIEYCLIKWDDSSASFIGFDGHENHELGNYLVNEIIVGNIHQNPELLKD